MKKTTHSYAGLWVTKDRYIRHELLPDGRYVEARGNVECAYTGHYQITDDHIEYQDDTGFTADGDFINGILYHAGMVLHRERSLEFLNENYQKEDDTRMSIKNKVVLVTGGSSGIGAATVDLLAENGAKVIAAARRTDRLETLVTTLQQKGYHADYKQLDVTDFGQMQQTVQEVTDAYGKIDVIVNNAGVMPLSKLDSLKIAEWNRMIDVNIRGVLHGIGAVLPVMKEQNSGHIVNIASIGAYEVTPTAAVYCATKYAVRAITEGLRQEATNNIRATVIAPGVTESELADHITDKQASEAMIEYRRQALPASAIAHAILYAISQPVEIDVSELIVRPTLSL